MSNLLVVLLLLFIKRARLSFCDDAGEGYYCKFGNETTRIHCVWINSSSLNSSGVFDEIELTCPYGCYRVDNVPNSNFSIGNCANNCGLHSICPINGGDFCCSDGNGIHCGNDGRVDAVSTCSAYGCLNGTCLAQCDEHAKCIAVEDGSTVTDSSPFCCNVSKMAQCNSGIIILTNGSSVTSCANGCWEGECVVQKCHLHAICSPRPLYTDEWHCCEEDFRTICMSGRVTTTEYCPNGCLIDFLPGECAAECEVGSFCDTPGEDLCCSDGNGIHCGNDGRVDAVSTCSTYGCLNGTCLAQCDEHAKCIAVEDGSAVTDSSPFCCDVSKMAQCNSGIIILTNGSSVTPCANGCWEGECVIQKCHLHAICSPRPLYTDEWHCCEEDFRTICESGRVTTTEYCPNGCLIEYGECAAECEVGSFCDTPGEDICCSASVTAATCGSSSPPRITDTSDCKLSLGCNPSTHQCNSEACHEGGWCFREAAAVGCCLINTTYEVRAMTGGCSEGRINGTSTLCDYGCFGGECLISSQCGTGSACTASDGSKFCCGDHILSTCTGGMVTQNMDCEFGCSLYERRCFERDEVGSFCDADTCTDDLVADIAVCDGGRVALHNECPFSCYSSSVSPEPECFDEHHVGSACEGSTYCGTISTDYLITCEDSKVGEALYCPFGCDVSAESCYEYCVVGSKESSISCDVGDTCQRKWCCCDPTTAVHCSGFWVNEQKSYPEGCTLGVLNVLNDEQKGSASPNVVLNWFLGLFFGGIGWTVLFCGSGWALYLLPCFLPQSESKKRWTPLVRALAGLLIGIGAIPTIVVGCILLCLCGLLGLGGGKSGGSGGSGGGGGGGGGNVVTRTFQRETEMNHTGWGFNADGTRASQAVTGNWHETTQQ